MDPFEPPEPEQFSYRPTLTPIDDSIGEDLSAESWDLSEDFFTMPPPPQRIEVEDEEDLYVAQRRSRVPLWLGLGGVLLGAFVMLWPVEQMEQAEMLPVDVLSAELPPKVERSPAVIKKKARHSRRSAKPAKRMKRARQKKPHPPKGAASHTEEPRPIFVHEHTLVAEPPPVATPPAVLKSPPAAEETPPVTVEPGVETDPMPEDLVPATVPTNNNSEPISVKELPPPLALGELASGAVL